MNSTQKETSRFLIRRFCERVEANRASIHYAQIRPMPFGRLQNFTTDCSGLVTCAYRWADIYSSFAVSDPNGLAYSGQGYTGTLLAHNKKHCVPLDRKFFVGDMGIYGTSLSNTTHVVICRKDGDVNTSIWTSHGSEDGPYPVRLHYRSDLLVVVRSGDLV